MTAMETPPPSPRKARRPLLALAVGFLAVAVAAFALDSSLAVWPAVAGTILLVLYFTVRSAAVAPAPDELESIPFVQSTTVQDLPPGEDGTRPGS
jgi:membrane associated rhomboid family serine protease